MINQFSKQSIIFTVGVHGDEHSPVVSVQSTLSRNKFIICHPSALAKNVRFLESDLNRSFPGNQTGTIEEKVAYKLTKIVSKPQFVVDIHTATCSSPPFIIMTKVSSGHFQLAQKTGVNKVVIMSQEFGAGKSLIDFAQMGISIESGREKSPQTKLIIQKIINQIINNKTSKKSPVVFKVFKTLTKTNSHEHLMPNIRSFKLVSAGSKVTNLGLIASEDFYPVLARSKNYPNFLCLMAKKINLIDLNVKISSSL